MMSVKVGDQIGEFKVARILPDRIAMEAAGDSFEVLLYDLKAPKQRTSVRTEARPATITSALPTGPSVPAAVPSPTPAATAGSGSTPAPAPTRVPSTTATTPPTQPSPSTPLPAYRRLTRETNPGSGVQAVGPVAPESVGPFPPGPGNQ